MTTRRFHTNVLLSNVVLRYDGEEHFDSDQIENALKRHLVDNIYGPIRLTEERNSPTMVTTSYTIETIDQREQLTEKTLFTEGLTFGQALVALKQGCRVAREGWNGKGMWLKLVPRNQWSLHPGAGLDLHLAGIGMQERYGWIGMKTTNNDFGPWLASQTDMLAEDWVVLP
jgi:hypothetical protein